MSENKIQEGSKDLDFKFQFRNSEIDTTAFQIKLIVGVGFITL